MSEKKPRSALQNAAFEKARSAREANMRKKWEEEQQQQKESAPPQQDVVEEEADEDESGEVAPPVHAATPRPPPQQLQQDDSHDYIELDTDDLFNQLSDHKREIKELKEHLHGLKQGHEELQTTWQQYNRGSNAFLSFV
jgi:hypothetical protein